MGKSYCLCLCLAFPPPHPLPSLLVTMPPPRNDRSPLVFHLFMSARPPSVTSQSIVRMHLITRNLLQHISLKCRSAHTHRHHHTNRKCVSFNTETHSHTLPGHSLASPPLSTSIPSPFSPLFHPFPPPLAPLGRSTPARGNIEVLDNAWKILASA